MSDQKLQSLIAELSTLYDRIPDCDQYWQVHFLRNHQDPTASDFVSSWKGIKLSGMSGLDDIGPDEDGDNRRSFQLMAQIIAELIKRGITHPVYKSRVKQFQELGDRP